MLIKKIIKILFVLLLLPTGALASRKGDIINKLVEDERYEVARQKCSKWNGISQDGPADLRENCAKAFREKAETTDTIAAWEAFRKDWGDTKQGEATRNLHAKAILRELAGKGTEEQYSQAVELAKTKVLRTRAIKQAIQAALKQVKTEEEAVRVAKKYPQQPDILQLAARFPDAFFHISIKGRQVSVNVDPPLPIEKQKIEWVARWSDGTMRSWDQTVRATLESVGIPRAHIMRLIQSHKGPGPALPLCPLSNQPADFSAGISIKLHTQSIFKKVPWDSLCKQAQPTLLSIRGGRVLAISLGPTHRVDLTASNNRSVVGKFMNQQKSLPYLFSGKVYIPFQKSFVVYPLDGSASYISERPPGAWKIPLNRDLRGEKLPKDWKLNLVGNSVIISTPTVKNWRMPDGEIRLLSPLASHILGLSNVIPKQSKPFSVTWKTSRGGLKTPVSAASKGAAKISAGQLRNLGVQLAGAGFSANEVQLFDGWKVDIDKDGADEFLLRAQISAEEVAVVLDRDAKTGLRTFVFRTPHASHGKRPAPRPFTFEKDGKTVIAWTGKERSRYVEWIFADRGGYQMRSN